MLHCHITYCLDVLVGLALRTWHSQNVGKSLEGGSLCGSHSLKLGHSWTHGVSCLAGTTAGWKYSKAGGISHFYGPHIGAPFAGLVHYQQNLDCYTATYTISYNNEDPGTQAGCSTCIIFALTYSCHARACAVKRAKQIVINNACSSSTTQMTLGPLLGMKSVVWMRHAGMLTVRPCL